VIREILDFNKDQTALKLSRMNWETICYDTETTSLKQDELEITGLSLCDGKYNYYIPIRPENRKTRMNIFKQLFSRTKRLIGHNLVFDLRVLNKYDIKFSPKTKLFDTMIVAHLINENDKKGLKHLTRTILNREVKDYDEKLSHYSKEFYNYGLDDSYNTWLLYEHYLPLLKEEKLDKLFFKIEMPFQWVLLEMALEGVLIDKKLLKEQQEKLKTEIQNLEIELLEHLGERYTKQLDFNNGITIISNINFNSSKQLIDIFNKLGLEITEKTPSGAPSIGVKTINKHLKNPFVEKLYKYKIANKLYNGFVSDEGQIISNLQKDGRVRPNFIDVGTKTGRLACVKPNLQQLPKPKDYAPVNVREVFVAPKGYKMFSCDYSGQEVAVMAQQSKDPTLVKALNNGYDMHLAVANTFYNLEIPEEYLSKKHPKYKEYKKKYSKLRSQAKTITFGLAYGKGAYGFAKDFNVSEEEAQTMVDNYFKGMGKLKEAINKAHQEVEETGTVTHMAGRKRHFNLTKDSEFYEVERAKRQSFNFLIQGFSADMIRAAAINVQRRNKNKEWDLKPIMTIHDEFNYIVKEEYAKEAAIMVKQAFEDVAKTWVVPVTADVEIGENYGNAK